MPYLYFLYLCTLNTKRLHTMKKFFLLLLCVGALSFTSCADKCTTTTSNLTSREEVDANPRIAVPSMTAYTGEIFTNEASAIPAGYEPFYITAYLRHGSRFESDQAYATQTYDYFQKADEAGILTPLGKRVKEFMEWNYNHHTNRVGDLTDVGFNQHKGIAKRYYKRFSSLFKGDAAIESVSSTSLRATMSMVGFNEGLKEENPRLNNHMMASEVTGPEMRPQKPDHNPAYPVEESKAYKSFLAKEVYAKLLDWGSRQDLSHAHNALFTDPAKFFSLFERSGFKIMTDIYKRLAFAQNFGKNDRSLIDEVFTADERYIIYKHENCCWYYRCASAAHPVLANNMVQSRVLVDYIVNRADEVVSGAKESNAHLCFGHDLNIIPLMNIFGLDNMPLVFGEGNETIDYVAENWRGYKVTPKAANLFFIFYRNKDGKVLVRPQINERDVEMPVESEMPYFYEWDKVKELAYARLAELDIMKQAK